MICMYVLPESLWSWKMMRLITNKRPMFGIFLNSLPLFVLFSSFMLCLCRFMFSVYTYCDYLMLLLLFSVVFITLLVATILISIFSTREHLSSFPCAFPTVVSSTGLVAVLLKLVFPGCSSFQLWLRCFFLFSNNFYLCFIFTSFFRLFWSRWCLQFSDCRKETDRATEENRSQRYNSINHRYYLVYANVMKSSRIKSMTVCLWTRAGCLFPKR